MKLIKYVLILLLAASVSCSKDTTTNSEIENERNSLQKTEAIGLYKKGESLLLFNKVTHQLLSNPTKYTFRIQDDSGNSYVNLQLEAMPTTDKQVKGNISDSFGFNIGSIDDIILLKTDDKNLWFWSDKARIGFIFPKLDI